MAMPTVPVAHFIVIQAGLALGLLDTLLNRVVRGGSLCEFQQRRVGGPLNK